MVRIVLSEGAEIPSTAFQPKFLKRAIKSEAPELIDYEIPPPPPPHAPHGFVQ